MQPLRTRLSVDTLVHLPDSKHRWVSSTQGQLDLEFVRKRANVMFRHDLFSEPDGTYRKVTTPIWDPAEAQWFMEELGIPVYNPEHPHVQPYLIDYPKVTVYQTCAEMLEDWSLYFQ